MNERCLTMQPLPRRFHRRRAAPRTPPACVGRSAPRSHELAPVLFADLRALSDKRQIREFRRYEDPHVPFHCVHRNVQSAGLGVVSQHGSQGGRMMTTSHSKPTPSASAYALGDEARERERLDVRATAARGRDWRVLDAGAGTGSVAFLIADLVGPSGSVIAVDRSPDMLATLRRWANEHGYRQIATVEADLNALPDLEPFGAVVGRLVLMHQPDPTKTLRSLARLVRPGGALAFLEYHLLHATTSPHRRLCEEAISWVTEAMRRAGIHIDMGLRLYATFRAAGLPAPVVQLEPLIGTGEAAELLRLLTETTRTCLPLIERFGLASSAVVAIETLEERLLAEARDGRRGGRSGPG
ncbi:MAG: hypothetical protein C4346_02560 [Chloroflexota bacterium]